MHEVITDVLSQFEKKLIAEDELQQRTVATIFVVCYLFYIFGGVGFLVALLLIFSIFFDKVRTFEAHESSPNRPMRLQKSWTIWTMR